jgi:hypothetical protein
MAWVDVGSDLVANEQCKVSWVKISWGYGLVKGRMTNPLFFVSCLHNGTADRIDTCIELLLQRV